MEKFTNTLLLRLFAVHIALVAFCASSAIAQNAKTPKKEQFAVAGCKVSNLQVNASGAKEATLTMDYDYDGKGRPPIKIITVMEKKGSSSVTNSFHVEDAEIPVGQGSVSVKVRYLKDEPLTTDRVKVHFRYPISKYQLGTATFEEPISWGDKGAEKVKLPPATAEMPVTAKASEEVKTVAAVAPTESAAKPVEVAALQNADAPVAAGGSFSAMHTVKRAPWQEKLTLGPGDVLHFSLFGEPDLVVEDVFIGPDGRLSYLEAQNVMASGLTVDELRTKFDEELGKFRRSPRVIITPAAFHSKKYFVLGRVSQKGVFTLDRPVTVIEAIARARGFETGMSERDLTDLADLSHSFIARRGQRVPVDFEKLFLEGDLSQNIPLEPNDYLYFPATDVKEVYVLGEVKFPGSVNFAGSGSTIGAISQRGGFTEKAWRSKVLVVRGSLNKPETFVVDMKDVLAARTPDFKLQPKDIVFVSSRPWAKAEELLDVLATAFVQAAVITWTGGNIGSIIK
ncbi:MAG TPA: polysaccharide biosynthesis/export family protein [Verrucomicrobiae bacterium]